MQSTREMLASWHILHPSLASGREIARRWLAYFQQRNHITRPPRVALSLCRSTCFLSDEDRTRANAKLARSTGKKPRKSALCLPIACFLIRYISHSAGSKILLTTTRNDKNHYQITRRSRSKLQKCCAVILRFFKS